VNDGLDGSAVAGTRGGASPEGEADGGCAGGADNAPAEPPQPATMPAASTSAVA